MSHPRVDRPQVSHPNPHSDLPPGQPWSGEKGAWVQRLLTLVVLLLALRFAGDLAAAHLIPRRVVGTAEAIALPAKLGAWTGKALKVDPKIARVLRPGKPSETLYTLMSRDGSGTPLGEALIWVSCSPDWEALHQPAQCFLASGGVIAHQDRKTLHLGSQSLTLSMVDGEQQGHEARLAYLFTDARGESTSVLPTLVELNLDRITRRNGNAAQVQYVYTQNDLLPDGEFTPDFKQLVFDVARAVREGIAAQDARRAPQPATS